MTRLEITNLHASINETEILKGLNNFRPIIVKLRSKKG